MKRLMLAVCSLTFVVVSHASAQQFHQDVVYLKDGSIVRGIIIEHNIGESLKIQTQGGSVVALKMANVLKITKELPVAPVIYKEKSPGIAFVCSVLMVGAGQAYNGQDGQAFVHWGVAAVCIGLVYSGREDNTVLFDPDGDDDKVIVGVVVGLSNWIVSMISAPIAAAEINKRNRQHPTISFIRDRLLLEPHTSRKTTGAMVSLRF